MESVKVRELVAEIDNVRRDQTSVSAKDEVRVMRAMLNDPTFTVDVYGKQGVEGQYCPYNESRTMVAKILQDTARITGKEAAELASRYQFGKQESSIMVGLAKEYINTYMETGRKLPLGGRERSNISIAKKVKEARQNSFPKKTGINDDGTDRYETVDDGYIPAHGSLKVYSSCPPWVKDVK